MLHQLLVFLLAISWTCVNGHRLQAAAHVDFYQLPMRPDNDGNDGAKLVLVCQGSGTLTGISVRLYCPVADPNTGQRSGRLSLCFENCSRTHACSADWGFCSPAACSQEIKGQAKFAYTFDSVAAVPGLRFECAYGWKRSTLSIADIWQAKITNKITTKITTKTTIQDTNKSTQFATANAATGVTATAPTASVAASEQNASSSHGTTTAGLTMIDKLVIFIIAGFCAVTLLAVIVLAVVSAYCVLCRRKGRKNNVGRSSTRNRDSIAVEHGRDPDDPAEKTEPVMDQMTHLLEMGPRPDLLPSDLDHM